MITDLLTTTTDAIGDEWITDGNFSAPAFWKDAVVEMAERFLATRKYTEIQSLFLALKTVSEVLLEQGQELVDENIAKLEAELHAAFPRENAHELAQKMAKRFAREQDQDERAVFGAYAPGELSGSAYRRNGPIARMMKSLNEGPKE
jgi:hypothetical protein